MARTFAGVVAVLLGFCSPSFAADTGLGIVTAASSHQVAGASNRAASDAVALGARYENGDGVAKDYERARLLYCEAAQRGEPGAFLGLGWMYLNGRGVERNDGIAVAWLQKAAARGTTQAVNLLRLMPNTAPAIETGCPKAPDSRVIRMAVPTRIRDLIARTAQDVGIEPQLLMAVIAVESAFNPRAVSPKNAQGLMQLMPETALRFGVRDPFDEQENVRGGATYLRDLLKRFRGDVTLALAAYNAGEGAILLNGGVPPYQETKDYIERVTRLCACFGALVEVAAR